MIANPVGADQPAKSKKKDVLCFHRPVDPSTVHSPGGASYFLSRRDVIASFSFGACMVHRIFHVLKFFVNYCQDI